MYQSKFEELLKVKLRPNSSGEAKARCPFHDDHRPSLNANVKKGVWYCPVCAIGGNIYQLAKRLGRSLPMEEPIIDQVFKEVEEAEQSKLSEGRRLQILELAAEVYVKQLRISEAKENLAKQYLKEKMIQEPIWDKYLLGFAKGNGLTDQLIKGGFSLDECIESGVTVQRKDGPADFFKDSLIIPVIYIGKVISLVARQLGANATPKYLNLRGEIKHLYCEDILNQAAEFVVICEGAIDTLTLIQCGLPAVGILGAGCFKPEFKEKVARIKEIYLCLDNDPAGNNGMAKIAGIFDGHVKVISLPKEEDLNDFFKSFYGRI